MSIGCGGRFHGWAKFEGVIMPYLAMFPGDELYITPSRVDPSNNAQSKLHHLDAYKARAISVKVERQHSI